jgi:hypothetical protein
MKPSVRKAGQVLSVEGALGPAERKWLARYPASTVLTLRRVTIDDLTFLDALPELEHLQLYATRIADWSALSRVQTLRRLFVNGVKDPGSLAIVSRTAHLRQLSLANLPTLTKLPDLSSCRDLREVRLWNCKRLGDITALLHAPALEELSLVATPHVPSDLIPLLALPRLEYLSATFESKRANDEFAALLTQHGKRASRAAT